MTAPKAPQDHQEPKDAPFTFEAETPNQDGKPTKKRFTLPKVTEDAAYSVPGEITYAAVMEPDSDAAQLRLAFATLEAAKPSEAAMNALKSLPTSRMLEVVMDWMGKAAASSDS